MRVKILWPSGYPSHPANRFLLLQLIKEPGLLPDTLLQIQHIGCEGILILCCPPNKKHLITLGHHPVVIPGVGDVAPQPVLLYFEQILYLLRSHLFGEGGLLLGAEFKEIKI